MAKVKASKQITAPYYTDVKPGVLGKQKPDPNGYLLSLGIGPTQITARDLPEWYIPLKVRWAQYYINAKDVWDLFYMPNYHTGHLHKDDILFVSFYGTITPTVEPNGRQWAEGYDLLLYGDNLVRYMKAVIQHSKLDISRIVSEIREKEAWVHAGCPEDQIEKPDWGNFKRCSTCKQFAAFTGKNSGICTDFFGDAVIRTYDFCSRWVPREDLKLPVFKSKLSMEQIENNFIAVNFYEALMAGLDEALEHAKSKEG